VCPAMEMPGHRSHTAPQTQSLSVTTQPLPWQRLQRHGARWQGRRWEFDCSSHVGSSHTETLCQPPCWCPTKFLPTRIVSIINGTVPHAPSSR
jgi:hypothetical protein